MNKNITILALSLSVLIASCSTKDIKKDNKVDDNIPVSVVSIEQANASQTIEATGTLTTDDETYLSFKTGGIIKSIFVKEGDVVKAGQVLATLDLTEIRTMVEQARIGYEKAKRDAARVRNLYRDSVATLEQLQNVESLLELSRQQLTGAEFNLSHSEIRALKNGVVMKKFANDGQMSGPGTPVLLVNGAGSGKWILRVGLSDQLWNATKVGDKAEVTISAIGNELLQATVVRKSEMADPYTGTFSVDVALNNSHSKIAAGMIGKVMIHPSIQSKVWTVPYEALLDANGDESYAFVVGADNVAKKVKVKLGAVHNQSIEIISGLESYSLLITKGNAYLKDGSKVKIK